MGPNDIANLLIPLAGMATGAVVVVTIGRLLRHWVDQHYQRARGGDDVRGDVEQLRREVLATRELAERMVELEERVDFAERLLAQSRERERGRLPGPGV